MSGMQAILAALGLAVFAAGCSTVRYTARVVDAGYRQDAGEPVRNIYRISRYSAAGGGSYVVQSVAAVSKEAVATALESQIRLTSGEKTVSIPVAVKVTSLSDRRLDGGSFLNGITFGLLPFDTVQESVVRVNVSPMDMRVAFREREFDVKLEHKSRFTPFFGLWPYLPEDDDVICRTKFGGRADVVRNVKEVFVQALGRGLAEVLARVDADVTMRGETFLANESAKRRTNAMKPKETVEDKAAKRSMTMKAAKCDECGSLRDEDGKCPLCEGK